MIIKQDLSFLLFLFFSNVKLINTISTYKFISVQFLLVLQKIGKMFMFSEFAKGISSVFFLKKC